MLVEKKKVPNTCQPHCTKTKPPIEKNLHAQKVEKEEKNWASWPGSGWSGCDGYTAPVTGMLSTLHTAVISFLLHNHWLCMFPTSMNIIMHAFH